MTARPVAAGARADVHGHADAIAGVEAGAAHLGEIPSRAEIARAPFRIGFKPAAGNHHRLAGQVAFHAVVTNAHAFHAHAVGQELERARLIADLDAALGCGLGQHLDETRPAADGLDRKPAPELELALDLECLAAVDGNEADALLAQPAEGVEAPCDQKLDHIRIGAVLGPPRTVR